MNAIGEASVSLWMDTATLPKAPPLKRDAECDVVVVGSGIAGLSTAYELAKLGERVIVLDRGELGGGMTSRTSAHLTSTIDDLYSELISQHGEATARAYARMRLAFIDRIEAIAAEETIACDFKRVDGYLFPAKSGDTSVLEDEVKACRTVGLKGVRFVDDTPIAHAGAGDGRALLFPNQARFHPRKYLAGLIRAIRRSGGTLHADTSVVAVDDDAGGVLVVTEAGPSVRARAAVIATNAPIKSGAAVPLRQTPYRSYVIAGAVPRGSVPDALYWDTLDPYHYVRLQPAPNRRDWLIVGGEDHETGAADDADRRLAKLESWARSLVPALGEIAYRWSGQVLDTSDYLPFTGRNPGSESIFIHGGDSGEGLANGVIGSLVLRDLVRGRKNRNAAMLDPARTSLADAGGLLAAGVSLVSGIAGRLTGGGRQPACTACGGTLHFNAFEQCWDCPRDGSQFGKDGAVLNAPATEPFAGIAAD